MKQGGGELRMSVSVAGAIGLLLFLFPGTVSAANKYWVGSAGGNINSTANWSDSSGNACGVGGGATLPTKNDVMVFDGTCDNDATINAATTVKGFLIESGYSGTISKSSNITLSIGSDGYTQHGGTFTSVNRQMVVNGDFLLDGGTFNTPPTFDGQLVVTGTFLIPGGTFLVPDGGTVSLVRGQDSTIPAFPTIASLTVSDGLVHHWKLDEGTGSTTLDFAQIQDSHGTTSVGVTWVSDAPSDLAFRDPYALRFTGSANTCVNISRGNFSGANNGSISNVQIGDMTASVWAKHDGTTGNNSILLTKDGLGSTNHFALRANPDGTYSFRIRGTVAADDSIVTSNAHPLNEWTHIAGVKTAGTMTIYVNGVADNSTSSPANVTFSAESVVIGARGGGGTSCSGSAGFTGLIADARLYNRALTAGEVANLADGHEFASGDEPEVEHTLSSDLVSATRLVVNHAILNLNGHDVSLTNTFSNTGVLKLRGDETITSFTNDTNSGTVEYNGSGSYSSLSVGDTYHSVSFTGGGTYTLDNDLTAGGAFRLSSGAFAQSTHAMSVADDFTLGSGTAFTKSTDASPLSFLGDLTFTDSNSSKQNLGVVVVGASPDTLELASDMTADDLTISLGDRLNTNGFDITLTDDLSIAGTLDATDDEEGDGSVMAVAGDWSNTGTFTRGNSRVSLTGTNQSISGSNTFFDLLKTVATVATLTFEQGSTQTVAGALTLEGASGNVLSLRSSVPGVVWNIDPQGSRTVSYLDVQDSNNTNTTVVSAYNVNAVDSGNNTGWNFTTPPASAQTGSSNSTGRSSVSSRVKNLIAMGKQAEADALKEKWSNLFGATTSSALIENTAGSEISTAGGNSLRFDRNLTLGMSGTDVQNLQKYLNANGFMLATSGPGSVGNETLYFGQLTLQALKLFQEAHGSAILVPHNLTQGTGYFGPITRIFIQGS